MGNFYGEIAGFQHSVKRKDMAVSDEFFRKKMLDPPKSHTRASAMANSYVNANTMRKACEDTEQAKSLFKMKKFMQVEPRTSSKNPTYKPLRRSQTAMKTATRPNPVFGAR